MSGSTGRERSNDSHIVKVRDLAGNARQRLAEIGQDDVSGLFSLRLSATERIYGIRDRRALKQLGMTRITERRPRQSGPCANAEGS